MGGAPAGTDWPFTCPKLTKADMPRLTPVRYEKLKKVFEKSGFVLDRTEGDHLVYMKTEVKRPVVIPMYRAVPVFIINNNLKTAGITRAEYFRLLKS